MILQPLAKITITTIDVIITNTNIAATPTNITANPTNIFVAPLPRLLSPLLMLVSPLVTLLSHYQWNCQHRQSLPRLCTFTTTYVAVTIDNVIFTTTNFLSPLPMLHYYFLCYCHHYWCYCLEYQCFHHSYQSFPHSQLSRHFDRHNHRLFVIIIVVST